MRGVNDCMGALEKHIAQARTANAEVVVRCPAHGEFTRNELINRNMQTNNCPECAATQQQTENQTRRRREALAYFEASSGVPARFQPASFANYQPQTQQAAQILSNLKEYVANFEQYRAKGLSLILCGTTGTGKTHLACAILRALAHDQGCTGLYDTAYRAIQRVRATYKTHDVTEQDVIAPYVLADLLVLDEIGVQYGTDSEKLILFSILNGRYEELKPCVLVSNVTAEEIKDYLGDRVFDRMRENGGAVLAFTWASYRRGNHASR